MATVCTVRTVTRSSQNFVLPAVTNVPDANILHGTELINSSTSSIVVEVELVMVVTVVATAVYFREKLTAKRTNFVYVKRVRVD
jgi:hypothetical protein